MNWSDIYARARVTGAVLTLILEPATVLISDLCHWWTRQVTRARSYDLNSAPWALWAFLHDLGDPPFLQCLPISLVEREPNDPRK
jgi:hypothetical protein